jgi:hypothetical protein
VFTKVVARMMGLWNITVWFISTAAMVYLNRFWGGRFHIAANTIMQIV